MISPFALPRSIAVDRIRDAVPDRFIRTDYSADVFRSVRKNERPFINQVPGGIIGGLPKLSKGRWRYDEQERPPKPAAISDT
jgi:hypothetical protein